MPFLLSRAVLIAGLALSLMPPALSQAADRAEVPPPPGGPPAMGRTGKERLGDKASDEQRVDDCKVPVERRTRLRPDACEWIGS